MLLYATVFLVVALIAALFGFTDIAAGAAGLAQFLFIVFMLLALAAAALQVAVARLRGHS